MIWNEEIETMDRESMRKLQLEKLKDMVRRVENHPFHKERLQKAGVTADNIKSLEDLQKIPFTMKSDLRDNYPFGLFAADRRDIVRIHASSGTTGKPTVVGYTKRDLDNWAECIARLATMGGATADDIAQIAFGYGLFTGAFGLHYGLEKIGAMVVPTSSGNTRKQIMLMQDFGTTVLVGTPSYALYIAEVMDELKIDRSKIKLKYGLFGGEGSTEEMRAEIERRFGIVATENYGLSEVMGPGVAGECTHKCGMHINEDHFIAEIINPETGEVLPEGATGELVLTPISKEALPIFRYRTRDITSLRRERCACGRESMRMSKIQGRSDDMLIIKGVNVFPSQVESVILGMEHIGPHYQLVVTKKGFTDALEIKVELTDGSLLESYGELEKMNKMIKERLHSVLGIDAKISLVEPKSLERFTGKAKRVIDLR